MSTRKSTRGRCTNHEHSHYGDFRNYPGFAGHTGVIQGSLGVLVFFAFLVSFTLDKILDFRCNVGKSLSIFI